MLADEPKLVEVAEALVLLYMERINTDKLILPVPTIRSNLIKNRVKVTRLYDEDVFIFERKK